jgi:hypothetical protein
MIRWYVRMAFRLGRALPEPSTHVVAGLVCVLPFVLLFRNWTRLRLLPASLSTLAAHIVSFAAVLPDALTTPRRRSEGLQPLQWAQRIGERPVQVAFNRLSALENRRKLTSSVHRGWTRLLVVIVLLIPIGGKLATLGKGAEGPWQRAGGRVFEIYESVASWSGLEPQTPPQR